MSKGSERTPGAGTPGPGWLRRDLCPLRSLPNRTASCLLLPQGRAQDPYRRAGRLLRNTFHLQASFQPHLRSRLEPNDTWQRDAGCRAKGTDVSLRPTGKGFPPNPEMHPRSLTQCHLLSLLCFSPAVISASLSPCKQLESPSSQCRRVPAAPRSGAELGAGASRTGVLCEKLVASVPMLCQPTGTSPPLPNFLCKSMNRAAATCPTGAFWGAERPQQVPVLTRAQGTGTLGATVLPSSGEGFPARALRSGRRAGWICLPGATFICTNSPWAGKVDMGLSLSPLAIGGECKHGWGGNAEAQGHPHRGVAAVGSSARGPTVTPSCVGLELGFPATGETGCSVGLEMSPPAWEPCKRGDDGWGEMKAASPCCPPCRSLSSPQFIFFLSAANPPVISSLVSIGGSATGDSPGMGRNCPSLPVPGGCSHARAAEKGAAPLGSPQSSCVQCELQYFMTYKTNFPSQELLGEQMFYKKPHLLG